MERLSNGHGAARFVRFVRLGLIAAGFLDELGAAAVSYRRLAVTNGDLMKAVPSAVRL